MAINPLNVNPDPATTGYYKVGTDVYANQGGTGVPIDQTLFQNLGINYNLLGEGIQNTKPLTDVQDTETKNFVNAGGALGAPNAAVNAGFTTPPPAKIPPAVTPDTLTTASGTTKEDTLALLKKAIEDQKTNTESVASLMTPTDREKQLQQDLLTNNQALDTMKQKVQERPLENGGILTSGIQSEINNIANGDTRASLVLMRNITQLSQQLSLETARRQAQLEVAKFRADQGQNDITNLQHMFDIQRQMEQDVLAKANTLTDNARQTLSTILTNFKGLTFDNLDSASQAKITDIANQLGIPLQVLKDGMQVVKNQIDLENRQNQFQLETARINATNNAGQGTFKIKDVLTNVQLAKLAASGIEPAIYTAITKALAAGDTLEQIRQDLIALKQNPKILDQYDAAVNIASVVKTLQGKTSSIDAAALIKNFQTTGSITGQ